MRDGWIETELGLTSTIVMGQSPPGETYNTSGAGLPFIQGSAEFGRHFPTPVKWCSDPRKIAEPNDLLISVRAPVGDLNLAAERTAIGRGLAIIRGGDNCLTSFLACEVERRRSDLRDRAGGGMFDSITRGGLSSLPIILPPLAVQRRIVDLIAAVDVAIEAAEVDHERSQGILGAVLTEWSEAWAGPKVRLGDLAEIGSGPSWSSREEYAEEVPGSTRVLGIRNTPPSGDVDLSDVTYVTGLPPRTRRLGPASVLMIRTNGNRSRIGNVYRVPVEAEGAAFSAFQIRIDLRDTFSAEFAFWMLAEPNLQRRISNEASGSTGLGNVGVKWLREQEVPWPEGDERRSVSALFNSIAEHLRQCKTVLIRFRQLRSALLADLLSSDHEIPASYDELLSA